MEKDSIPDETQGDLEDHSPTQESADITDESQSSQEEDNQFFGNDEQEETSDDTPSQETQESTDDTDSGTDESDSVDPELAKWAKSQNIALTTETEINLAKRLRDTQKAYHDKSGESKKKFDEAVTESANGDVNTRLEARLARYDFLEANPDAKELEGEMYDIALAARESGDEAGFKYYQTPAGWNTLLKIAKANKFEKEGESSFDAGREAERKNLAKKQQATKAKSNSQQSKPESSKVTDEQIANMSLAEYNKYRAEHPEFDPYFG